jgi:hypothetical protein
MAKILPWNVATPTNASAAGQGDDEIQTVKTFVADEHYLQVASNELRHKGGSARALVCTQAQITAWAAGGGAMGAPYVAPDVEVLVPAAAGNFGRLTKATDGPFGYYNAAGGVTRIVGGRYARTAAIAGAAQILVASTFTTVTGFSIAAFVLNATLDYRIRANAIIRKTAGFGTLGGLRVLVTEFGGATYAYEQHFNFDASNVQGVNFDCLHTAVAGGAAAIAFQVWINAACTIDTTAAALAGWAGAPNNSLDIMEI